VIETAAAAAVVDYAAEEWNGPLLVHAMTIDHHQTIVGVVDLDGK
jgi:hypothetical protein